MLYTINASFDNLLYRSSDYDFEHVISKALITSSNLTDIPGGTLGNMMYLEKGMNRSKKELNLYTAYESELTQVKEESLKAHFYPTKRDLQESFAELKKKNPESMKTKLIVEKRGKDIINSLVNHLYS